MEGFYNLVINMAGHSHWAGIKHKKGKTDKQKSKVFSKISREITVAAKLGAKDPEMNPRLRSAMQSAREANMPKDNVERAIDKSEINQTINFENLRYEGFGPEKIAVIVETLTDNKNRTASNIRTIFQKHGGNLGTLGSASHNFNQLGVIRIDKKEASDEEILEIAVEAGADECVSNDNIHQIFCSKENLYKVKNIIERKVSNFIFTGIEWIPLNKIDIVKEKIDSMINFIEALEDDDDVQNIYTNFKEKNFN